ncbi:MAG: LamG-like jellyroll fold domain-containing protein [Nanoarchaeota archaeon]|nr:LamG-like jellyroll fold domain-containing protein [Nanoarchaeota archaeon]
MKKNNKSLMFILTAILVLIIAVEVSAADVTNCPPGMVSYWKFDGSLTDKLGNYDGKMGSYGSYADGNINQGLYGAKGCSNPYAAKVNNFPNLDSFTLESWVKPDCPPGSYQGSLTISKWAGGYGGTGFILFTYPSPYFGSKYVFQLNIANGANGLAVTSPLTYDCGNWYHVVGVRDKGNELKLFINGEEVASALDNVVGSIANNDPLVFHGYTSGGCGWGMSAVTMDEVAIYNRVLSNDEIQQHYQNGLNGVGYCIDYLYVSQLQEQIDTLKTKVSSLEAEVTINDANIWTLSTTLGLLQSEVTALQSEITGLNEDVRYLQSQVDTLNTKLSDIETVLDGMNQGDLDLVWDSGENNLRVKIKFPYGSTSAKIYASDSNDNIKYGPIIVTPENQGETDYNWDVSNWDISVYTIKVNLLGSDGIDYYPWLSELFDSLAIRDLQTRMAQAETDVSNLEKAVNDNFGDIATLNDQMASVNIALSSIGSTISTLQIDVTSMQASLNMLTGRVNILQSKLNEMNHGTINMRYRAGLGLLEVWGEAPEGATKATLTIRSVSDFNTVLYTDSDAIINDGVNNNRYEFNQWTGDPVDINGFAKKSYNIQVEFTGSDGSYKVSGIFTNLELEGIQGSLTMLYNADTNLWIAVNDNTNEIILLWSDSENQWDAIDDLEAENADQWRAIRKLWKDSSAQWKQIDWLWEDSSHQWRAIWRLDNKVDRLVEKLSQMNHGTINLYHHQDENNYMVVWGEAPEGSSTAYIEVYTLDQTPFLDEPVYSREKQVTQNNLYYAFFNLEGWDPVKYNVYVHFSPSWRQGCTPLSCSVGALFDDLYLQQIGDDLYGSDEACMELGIPINICDNEMFEIPKQDTLLWLASQAASNYEGEGEVTLGEICSAYGEIGDMTYFLDYVYFNPETMYYTTQFLKCIGYDDEIHLSTFMNLCQEWEITNIENDISDLEGRVAQNEGDIKELKNKVKRLRQRLNAFMEATGQNFEQVWNDIEHVWSLIYGFEFIGEKVWTTYYMSGSITRPIVYSVIPQEQGLYTISLVEAVEEPQVQGEGVISPQVLEECVWLGDGVKNNIISYVTLPAPGEYKVYIQAQQGCYEGDDINLYESSEYLESNMFVITVEDLKYSMPETTLTITSPEPNKEDTYWTRSDHAFVLTGSAFLNGASVDSKYCTAIDTTSNTHFYTPVFWVTETYGVEGEVQERDYAQCSGIIIPSDMKFGVLGSGAEGVYSVFLDMKIEDAIDPDDTISIGVDDTKPVIGEINPKELEIVAGEVKFSVEATDEMSGVRNVQLSLVMKDGELKWTHETVYNPETSLWEVLVDTSELPDGSYDLKAEAWDYADNKEEKTIDPMIDNNPPVLSDASIGTKVCSENHLLDLSVVAIDSTSGVDVSTAYALVTGPAGSGITDEKVELVSAGSDLYKGSFNNVNIVSGDYTVVFYASDKAKHEGSLSAPVQTVEVASCPAPAPTGSSGGGGGSGGRKVTFTCNYNCGTWSDCANDKQTRTCTPNRYCEDDANKPETEKTCTVQITTQGSSTGTNEQQSGTEETGETTDEGSDTGGNTPTGAAVTQPTGFGAHPWLAGLLITAVIGGLGIFVYMKYLKS